MYRRAAQNPILIPIANLVMSQHHFQDHDFQAERVIHILLMFLFILNYTKAKGFAPNQLKINVYFIIKQEIILAAHITYWN